MEVDQRALSIERAPGLMRLYAIGAVGAWAAASHYLGWLPDGAWTLLLMLFALTLLCGVALLGWAIAQPKAAVLWRRGGHVLDCGSLAAAAGIGGETLVPASVAFLWVSVGNAIGLGAGLLAVVSAALLLVMAGISYAGEFWHAHVAALLGVAALVPIYMFVVLRQLKAANAAVVEASRAKSLFLAQASHDLRQPIHAISLFTSCLREAGLGARELRMVESIDRSLESVSRLFKSLLDVSTLDSGRVTPVVEQVAVQDILDDVWQQNIEAASRAGVDLRFVPCSAWIQTDRSLVATMLQNIVNNAIKYAPGSPVVVGCRRRRGRLAVMVLDQGPGIPAGHAERVFEEFYQVREHGDRDVEGVGLGLPIVKRLGGLLELQVDLQSRPGQGTAISIAGLKMAPPGQRASSTSQAPRPHSAMEGLRVLLVEDDEAVLAATASLLQSWGCEVLAASSVPGQVEDCDLLITDFDLGGGRTGLDCIRAVRHALEWDLPAVITTGHDADRVREELGDDEVSVLVKPVRPAELRSVILATAMDMRAGAAA